jgi:hypothetical protein
MDEDQSYLPAPELPAPGPPPPEILGPELPAPGMPPDGPGPGMPLVCTAWILLTFQVFKDLKYFY